MTAIQIKPPHSLPSITWEKLSPDFILPDEPVENNLQPLLTAALRESLELAGLILESMLVASNFGLCAKVDDETIVKAPDWVYIPSVHPLPQGEIRRSYTPHIEGENPTVVIEFISATEGGEYSINPHYPYGKWYFYEQILRIPVYVIFHPQSKALDVYFLIQGKYEAQVPDENGRFYLEPLDLFLGLWMGKKSFMEACWLRWWDKSGNLLLWGNELIEEERQRAEQERQRAEQERQRAEQECQRAEQEHQRANEAEQKAAKLAEKLRLMGINPEDISY